MQGLAATSGIVATEWDTGVFRVDVLNFFWTTGHTDDH
jgi:hypothetical protein